MDIQRYAKVEIVKKQIETAVRLFREGDDLFSVITLAGAAEEVLGELLQAKRGRRDNFRALMGMLRPLSGKGEPREAATLHETALDIHTDPRYEAVFLLGRAIDDFHAVTGVRTAAMEQFNKEFRSR